MMRKTSYRLLSILLILSIMTSMLSGCGKNPSKTINETDNNVEEVIVEAISEETVKEAINRQIADTLYGNFDLPEEELEFIDEFVSIEQAEIPIENKIKETQANLVTMSEQNINYDDLAPQTEGQMEIFIKSPNLTQIITSVVENNSDKTKEELKAIVLEELNKESVQYVENTVTVEYIINKEGFDDPAIYDWAESVGLYERSF